MRRHVELDGGGLIAYGHWGRPVLAFPSERGHAHDWEGTGMVEAVAGLLDAGRVKLYSVSSFDAASWHERGLSLEERARRHSVYELWVTESVVPWIRADCAGREDMIAAGCSFGAYHAANFALKRADVFPNAICMSGVYDVAVVGGDWERGDAVYFNNPMDYVANLSDPWYYHHLRQDDIHLATGHGPWEDRGPTYRFSELLRRKEIPHSLDDWGAEGGHDWPYWKKMMDEYVGRLF